MFRYILLALLLIALVASAQPFLTPEDHFFGIPNADSLTAQWSFAMISPPQFGPSLPMDVDILRLSPFDYRMVILGGFHDFFTSFRINQQTGARVGGVVCSGALADTSIYNATAMCQIRQGTYFNPVSDRVAVTFWHGQRIGIYQFDSPSGTFTLERSISIPITKPVGIFWAFNNFFVVDRSSQRIYRFDSDGNYVSGYGKKGVWEDRYAWLSDISGYVDNSNTAHLYVSDGSLARIDHLTAVANDTTISLYSQVWASGQDTGEYHTHDVALVPGVGVISLDRDAQRFYFWNRTDSLQVATRTYQDWGRPSTILLRIWQICGRLVVASIQPNVGWVLRSYHVTGATFDEPIPYPTDHWTIDISPVVISGVWHVTSGTNLIIDQGVEVQFERHAGLVVDGGGKLTVNGISGSRVLFHAAQSGQVWTGIKLESNAALNMAYSDVSDADSFCVFANTPGDSTSTPLHIAHCYFDGSKLISGKLDNHDLMKIALS